jgi:glyoxylase-like metal-dependent hydrolase (beta-lactamase superfamily II)
LTHQDIDHIGNLPELVRELDGRLEVICHETEKPYIQGDLPLIKFNPVQMQKLLQTMPEDRRKQFERNLENPPKASVNTTVSDGQLLPFCGGISVIFTPGHTPGHIGLYHKASRTLISGDSLVAEEGRLCGPRPQVAADIELAIKSLEKYKKYDIETVVCYHGGVVQNNVNRRIEELANSK